MDLEQHMYTGIFHLCVHTLCMCATDIAPWTETYTDSDTFVQSLGSTDMWPLSLFKTATHVEDLHTDTKSLGTQAHSSLLYARFIHIQSVCWLNEVHGLSELEMLLIK